MTKLPHWIEAYRGVMIGLSDFSYNVNWNYYSRPERKLIVKTHTAYGTALMLLYEFNTRDYAYGDRGGMTIDDIEMGDYDECEYINPDLL